MKTKKRLASGLTPKRLFQLFLISCGLLVLLFFLFVAIIVVELLRSPIDPPEGYQQSFPYEQQK